MLHSTNTHRGLAPRVTYDSAQQAAAAAAVGRSPVRSGLFVRLSNSVRRGVARIVEGIEYRKTVSALSRLDDRTLTDIGIDRQAIRERARAAVRDGRSR